MIKVRTTTLNQNDEPVQISVGNPLVPPPSRELARLPFTTLHPSPFTAFPWQTASSHKKKQSPHE